MARFCTACGKDIPDGVAFCTECGAKAPADNNTEKKEVKQEAAPATRTCKKCGAELKEGVAFCTECGASSKDEPADASTAEVKTEASPPTAEIKTETPPPVQEQRQQPPPQQTPIHTQAPPVQQASPQPQYTQQSPQGQPVYQNQQPYHQQAYVQPQYQQPAYHQPQPTYQQQPQPMYAAQSPAPKDESGGVVSTGTFFGTMLLFALPFIGFIACIIMCFAPKRKSLKNYAKANLIWAIIGLVFSILLVVAVIALGGSLMDYLSEAMGGGLGDLSGMQ